MDKRSAACFALFAVQKRRRRIFHGVRLEAVQNNATVVFVRPPCRAVAVGNFSLPALALIAPQVVNIKGAVGLAFFLQFALNVHQTLGRGVDGESSKVARNPATTEFLGDGCGRARAAEKIRDQVALVGGRLDNAFRKGFGFLCGVAQDLRSNS